MPCWPYSSRSFAFATPLFVPWVLFGSPASQPTRPALIVASQGCPPLQTAPARSTSYASLRATHQPPHTRVLHALHIRCRKQQRVRMRRTTKPASRARVVSMLHGGLISVDRRAAAASACRSHAYMPRDMCHVSTPVESPPRHETPSQGHCVLQEYHSLKEPLLPHWSCSPEPVNFRNCPSHQGQTPEALKKALPLTKVDPMKPICLLE